MLGSGFADPKMWMPQSDLGYYMNLKVGGGSRSTNPEERGAKDLPKDKAQERFVITCFLLQVNFCSSVANHPCLQALYVNLLKEKHTNQDHSHTSA